MNELLMHTTLLAAGENFDKFQQMGAELRRRTTEGSGDDFALLAMLALVVPLFVVLLVALVRMQDRRANLNSPKALFRELCKAHKLSSAERNLLKQLAATHELTDPARIFIEPERYDAGRLSSELRNRAAELDNLRKRLFARDPAPRAASNEKPPAEKSTVVLPPSFETTPPTEPKPVPAAAGLPVDMSGVAMTPPVSAL